MDNLSNSVRLGLALLIALFGSACATQSPSAGASTEVTIPAELSGAGVDIVLDSSLAPLGHDRWSLSEVVVAELPADFCADVTNFAESRLRFRSLIDGKPGVQEFDLEVAEALHQVVTEGDALGNALVAAHAHDEVNFLTSTRQSAFLRVVRQEHWVRQANFGPVSVPIPLFPPWAADRVGVDELLIGMAQSACPETSTDWITTANHDLLPGPRWDLGTSSDGLCADAHRLFTVRAHLYARIDAGIAGDEKALTDAIGFARTESELWRSFSGVLAREHRALVNSEQFDDLLRVNSTIEEGLHGNWMTGRQVVVSWLVGEQSLFAAIVESCPLFPGEFLVEGETLRIFDLVSAS